MRTKRKIILTLDEEICSSIDSTAKEYGISKSQLIEKVLKLWLEKETEKLITKGYDEMYDEDNTISRLTFLAQRETVN